MLRHTPFRRGIAQLAVAGLALAVSSCSTANRVQGAVAGIQMKGVHAALGFIGQNVTNGMAGAVVVLSDYELTCDSSVSDLRYVAPLSLLVMGVGGYSASLVGDYAVNSDWNSFTIGQSFAAFFAQGIMDTGAPTEMQEYRGSMGDVRITQSTVSGSTGSIDGTFDIEFSTGTSGLLQGDFAVQFCNPADNLVPYLLTLLSCNTSLSACLGARP